ncbi:MAG TPA: hypothetical protein VMH50_01575 [Thermoleophilia bacterium]|nr:hypothetical protein [Thermoleophilia bacterium]
MNATMTEQARKSRYQVRSTADPAWARDERGTLYRFDGLCFSRCRCKDAAFSLVPAWQTPCYGWLSTADYPCPVVSTVVVPAPKPAVTRSGLAA